MGVTGQTSVGAVQVSVRIEDDGSVQCECAGHCGTRVAQIHGAAVRPAQESIHSLLDDVVAINKTSHVGSLVVSERNGTGRACNQADMNRSHTGPVALHVAQRRT